MKGRGLVELVGGLSTVRVCFAAEQNRLTVWDGHMLIAQAEPFVLPDYRVPATPDSRACARFVPSAAPCRRCGALPLQVGSLIECPGCGAYVAFCSVETWNRIQHRPRYSRRAHRAAMGWVVLVLSLAILGVCLQAGGL